MGVQGRGSLNMENGGKPPGLVFRKPALLAESPDAQAKYESYSDKVFSDQPPFATRVIVLTFSFCSPSALSVVGPTCATSCSSILLDLNERILWITKLGPFMLNLVKISTKLVRINVTMVLIEICESYQAICGIAGIVNPD